MRAETRREHLLDAAADVERIMAELRDALERVRSLGSMVTVCGSCRELRAEDGQWRNLEEALSECLHVGVSHGLCPRCMKHLMDDLDREDAALHPPPAERRALR